MVLSIQSVYGDTPGRVQTSAPLKQSKTSNNEIRTKCTKIFVRIYLWFQKVLAV